MEFTKAEVLRFETKFLKGENSQCWEWTGSQFKHAGYGMFCMSGRGRRVYSAHRIAWMMSSGQDIPAGMFICHHCDNRLCVNPNHLYLGTPRQNNLDTVKRGRANRTMGDDCSWSKITEAQVIEILKSDYPRGANAAFAKRFGVTQSQISHIRSGKRWPHVKKLLQNG